jgi:hypothetical protein
MGHILQTVLAYEEGRWDDIDFPPAETAKFPEAYLQAVAWTDKVYQHI